jgi:hypothetical protein
MPIETKQTTFILIDEPEDFKPEDGDTGDINTASPSTDNGDSVVTNPYWGQPGGIMEDNGSDNANINPYWGAPFEAEDDQLLADQTTPAPNTTAINGTVSNGTSSTDASDDGGVLSSLRLYEQLRQDLPEDFVRPPEEDNTNVELFTMPDGNEIAFCHISVLLPFTKGDNIPWLLTHEDAAIVALALQDLNEGNGIIIPEIEGLNKRCNVRFTTEWADTAFTPGVAIKAAVEQLNRPVPEQTPCAFLGAYRSAVSMPTSIVTGIFGRPQISAASTSADLDDKRYESQGIATLVMFTLLEFDALMLFQFLCLRLVNSPSLAEQFLRTPGMPFPSSFSCTKCSTSII